MKCSFAASCLALSMLTAAIVPAAAEEQSKDEAIHDELRAVLREVTAAVNSNDLDRLFSRLDKDCVITWQNAEVSRGPQEVRAYCERMTQGEGRIVDQVTIEPTADDLTHLYGDTGVAFGGSKDHFRLTDGRNFEVSSRWTATVVKKDGRWLLASCQISASMFDNPVMWIAVRQTAYWSGGIAVLAGLILGIGATWLLGRKRSRLTPPA